MQVFEFDEIKKGIAGLKGVYWVLNIVNQNRYPGRGTFSDRFCKHQCLLRDNEHYNSHLQRSYNKYGPKAFRFVIYCIEENADVRRLIETLQVDFHRQSTIYEVYNSDSPDVDSPRLGVKWSAVEREKRMKNDCYKPYKIINPAGIVSEGKNIEEYCRNNNLRYNSLLRIRPDKNTRWHYKGYHFYDENHPEYACPIEEFLRLVEPAKHINRSEAVKLRGKWSQESRDKLSKTNTGRTVSNETRQKISKATKKQMEAQATHYYLYNNKDGLIYHALGYYGLDKLGLDPRTFTWNEINKRKTRKYRIWTLCSPLDKSLVIPLTKEIVDHFMLLPFPKPLQKV